MSELAELLKQTGVAEGQTVLDIGFGSADELLAIGSLVGEKGSVIGLERAREIHPLSGVERSSAEILVLEGSAEEISLPDSSVDLVLCKGVLHELRDLERAISEMVRVLKPGGTLSIIDFQPVSKAKFKLYRLIVKLRGRPCEDRHPGFSQEEMVRLLSPYGMKIEYQKLDEIGRLGWLKIPLFLIRAKKG